MQENKFEKQVREKMDQLGLDPSDAVWANVDREINKGKKRRGPVFWLLMLSGLVLMGGGYYFIAIKNSTNTIATTKQQRRIDKNKDRQSVSEVELNMNAGNKKSKTTARQYYVQTRQAHENKLFPKTVNQYRKNTENVLHGNGMKDTIVLKSGKEEISSGEMDFEKTESEIPGQLNNLNRNGIDSSAGKKIKGMAENKTSNEDSVSVLKSAKGKDQNSKPSSWKIGYTGSPGISNINQSLFKSANVINYYSASYAPGSATGPTAINASSKINAGFSFGIGVFVNRYLSKRVSFSAGIDYHYYSTKIKTGNVVDSSTLVYGGSVQAYSVNTFYRNGNDHVYTNQYHFIELPVTLNFQLNRSRQLPFIWEAGLSLSYLLSSNALFFDPLANDYYKNEKLFNKTQLNAVTSVMIGLHIHNSVLQFGPQFQYGLTGLLESNTGNSEHLFYYGLKIYVIPGEK
jgi:hypothetical protein